MRPPRFWRTPPDRPGLLARLLSPLGALHALATARGLARGKPRHMPVPVICVGYLDAGGGAGETQAVIALVQHLQAQAIRVFVVSGGHGGHQGEPAEVDASRHAATDVGDAPLLIAAFTRVWIARDRAAAADAATAAGADMILMEDGFQNPSLHKDLSMIVVDAVRGFGNGFCLPAGPLREPVRTGLARADILLSIGPDTAQDTFATLWPQARALPHLQGTFEPLQTGMDWQGARCLAFAGTGNPEAFFATLRGLGAILVRAEVLDDHQPLTPTLLSRLAAQAKLRDAQLVTTEKDAVRLPHPFRQSVITLPVRLTVKDWSSFDSALSRVRPS